jgi:hypothetical protein
MNHTNHRHLPEEFEMGPAVHFTDLPSDMQMVNSEYTDLSSTNWCDDIFHPPIV